MRHISAGVRSFMGDVKHAPDALCVTSEMYTSWCAKCAITSLFWHHAGKNTHPSRREDYSGIKYDRIGHPYANVEQSGRTEQAVPGQVGHNEEICAIVTR